MAGSVNTAPFLPLARSISLREWLTSAKRVLCTLSSSRSSLFLFFSFFLMTHFHSLFTFHSFVDLLTVDRLHLIYSFSLFCLSWFQLLFYFTRSSSVSIFFSFLFFSFLFIFLPCFFLFCSLFILFTYFLRVYIKVGMNTTKYLNIEGEVFSFHFSCLASVFI